MSKTPEETAADFLNSIKVSLAAIGLTAKVTYNKDDWRYTIKAAPVVVSAIGHVSEEIFFNPRMTAKDFALALHHELEYLQVQCFDETRKAMSAKDGKIATLTAADKNTLHNALMEMEINYGRWRGDNADESRKKELDNFRDLVGRLFR